MKKTTGFLGALLLASSITGGTAFAADSQKNEVENYQFNWSEAWDNVTENPDFYNDTTTFSTPATSESTSSKDMQMAAASFNEYARGSTTLRYSNYYVYSKGVTAGEALWTTTSVQTSLRNVDAGYITIYGDRDTAIAYGDAVSEVRKKYIPLDGNFFTGLSTHTATYNGNIYEKATSDSNIY